MSMDTGSGDQKLLLEALAHSDERAQASCEQPRGPARDCEPVVYTLLATTM
jgi:hypothetical protein